MKYYLLIILLVFPSPSFADPPQGYYDSAYGRTGQELKSSLHKIIDNHIVYPYTFQGNDDWYDGQDIDVWEALTYTDSACTDEMPHCGLVQLLYLDETRTIDQANRGSGSNNSWDREHVWPKSRGFAKKYQIGYTDLHHLRPADRNLNGVHSNYGYDDGGTIVFDKNDDDYEVETGARIDRLNQSFEPPDRAKGQVARMLFYMAVRYEVGDETVDENMPDLYLKDDNAKTTEPWIGDLCTLLKWNNMYGPTDFERRRNDRVMELQENRNPFIDNPGWANLIWKGKCQ